MHPTPLDTTTLQPSTSRLLAALVRLLLTGLFLSFFWAGLSSPGGAQSKQPVTGKTVNIYGWNDYIDPAVIEDFTRETGIAVVYDSYDNTESLAAKVLAGTSGYDIVVVSTTVLQQLVQSSALRPLDHASLSGRNNLSPDIMEKLSRHDPGHRYAVPYVWGTVGLGINVAKVRERLGENFPKSWDLLLEPRSAVKLKDCGIHLLDSADDLLPGLLAGHLRGSKLDAAMRNPSELAKAGDALFRMRTNIAKWGSSDAAHGLAVGDICLAVGFSHTMRQARTRAASATKPVHLDYLIPREGALMWIDSLVIPRGAPNADNALAFLAYMLRPDVAAANANRLGFATANAAARLEIKQALRADKDLYPDAETIKRLFTNAGFDERMKPAMAKVWTRFRTGK